MVESTNKVVCPFCNLEKYRIVLKNEHAFSIYDGFPISPGHCLIIPNRHVGSFFETTNKEQAAILDLLSKMQNILKKDYNPDGFNVGINIGEAGGQTIMHLHVHLIPRYAGDVPEPRGGIRWIFPEKADYWTKRF